MSNLLTVNYEVFEDTNFVTGDSPVTLNLNAVLGRDASDITVFNDGAGTFTMSMSSDGTTFGGAHTIQQAESFEISEARLHSVRINWVSNSAYRVVYI